MKISATTSALSAVANCPYPTGQDTRASSLGAGLQVNDGSWFDDPLSSYHKPYDTAFAILSLECCRKPKNGH